MEKNISEHGGPTHDGNRFDRFIAGTFFNRYKIFLFCLFAFFSTSSTNN